MQQREGLPVPQDQPPRLVGPHGEGDPLRRHHEQQPRRQPWSDPSLPGDLYKHRRSVCRALLIKCVCATDFYNWNRVKIRYCDGASFAGEGSDKAQQIFLSAAYIYLHQFLCSSFSVKLFICQKKVVVLLIWWSAEV